MQDHIRVVDITVVRGTVVSVVDVQTRQPLDAQDVAKYRTIDGLFDFVREAIDYPATSIYTVFEQDLGYPAEAGVDYVANIADEEMAFRVYSLIPILPR